MASAEEHRERAKQRFRNKKRAEKAREARALKKQLERARKANQEEKPCCTIVLEDDIVNDKKRKRAEDDTAEKETLKQRLQIAEERVRELEEVLLTIWPELRQKYNDQARSN
jgi:hypothetical protein